MDFEGNVVGQERVVVTDVPADLTGDGKLDVQDIDRLCAAILGQEPAPPQFDLNGDGQVDKEDHRFMVEQVFKTSAGDANLDGLFTSEDLIDTLQFVEYEDGIDGNSTWAEGDWNCDGDFNSQDLIDAAASGRYT